MPQEGVPQGEKTPGGVGLIHADYAAVRLWWCVAALGRFAKGWGSVVLSLLAVAAAVSLSPQSALMAVQALLAWAVWPLCHAGLQAGQFGWHVAAHATVGGVVVWMLRHRLWAPHWREAERALPIEVKSTRLSDLHVVALCLMPLAGVYVMGVAVWVQKAAVALRTDVLVSGMVGLGASLGMSLLEGWLMLRLMRWDALPGMRGQREVFARQKRPLGIPQVVPLRYGMALVWIPLLKGTAKRVGLALAWMSSLVCATFLLAGVVDEWAPLFMVLAGMVSLAVTPRLHHLVCSDLLPLHRASTALPLPQGHLMLMRRMLVLTPALLGLLGWWLAMALSVRQVRVHWGLAYALAWISSHLVLAPSEPHAPAGTVRRPAMSALVGRWLVFASVQGALAAQVLS